MAKTAGKARGTGKARAATKPTGLQARSEDAQMVAPYQEEPNEVPPMSESSLEAENEGLAVALSLDCEVDDEDDDASGALNPLLMLSQHASVRQGKNAMAEASAMHAAQMMAMQQAEYQRSLDVVRHQIAQRHLQQQLQQAGGVNVMQHIQQRLQERIQLKQHQQLYEKMRQQAGDTAMSPDFQQQLQQYHAMMREIEMQATHAASMQAAAVAVTSGEVASMTQEEIDRLRQDRLQRLHQLQLQKLQQQQQQHQHMQAQHAAALRVTLTGVPTPEQQQQQLLHLQAEQERLRQFQVQQLQETMGPTAQQSPQAQLVQPQKKRAGDENNSEQETPPPAAGGDDAPSSKKKRKTQAESQMESLVRVLCRLQLTKTEHEMRVQLDKMVTWIGKTVDICLLRFALRDFVELFGVKQKQFQTASTWTTDLLPKCTLIHDKLRHSIAALVSASVPKEQKTAMGEKEKIAAEKKSSESETDSTVAKASTSAMSPKSVTVHDAATIGNDTITQSAREHAYAALKEQIMTSLLTLKPRAPKVAVPLTPSTVGQSTLPTATSTQGAPTSAATEEAKTIPTAKKAKKRELTVDVDGSDTPQAKKPHVPTTVLTPAKPSFPVPLVRPTPPTPTVISPQLAQQLFDLDLTPRSCAVAPDEGEDRFYFPLKPISNIMRKVLPGGSVLTTKRRRKRRGGNDDVIEGDESKASKKNDEEDEDDDDGEEGEDKDANGEDVTRGDEDDGDDDEETKAETADERKESQAPLIDGESGEPPVKIDDAALVFMQECVSEFLLFFTSEARDQAMLEKKKGSITGTSVVQAMENLGFSAYAKVLSGYNDKVRKVQDEQAQQKLEKKNLAKKQRKQAEEEAKQRAAAAVAATTVQVKSEAATVEGARDADAEEKKTTGTPEPQTSEAAPVSA